MTEPRSLQDTYAPQGVCFGCGPANPHGLHIQSYADGNDVICTWTPQKHHEAFPGVLSGGIIGTLLDCHGVWTAANAWRVSRQLSEAPAVVTAEFTIGLKRPTPTPGPVHLRARVVANPAPDRAVVEGTLEAGGKICATLRGIFASVKEDHPAFHRW
jgi:acyl-coenzyme A thioesterase PaaI-like protein